MGASFSGVILGSSLPLSPLVTSKYRITLCKTLQYITWRAKQDSIASVERWRSKNGQAFRAMLPPTGKWRRNACLGQAREDRTSISTMPYNGKLLRIGIPRLFPLPQPISSNSCSDGSVGVFDSHERSAQRFSFREWQQYL